MWLATPMSLRDIVELEIADSGLDIEDHLREARTKIQNFVEAHYNDFNSQEPKIAEPPRQILYEYQKKLSMLEVLAANYAKMKALHETRRKAQEAAEEARARMLAQIVPRLAEGSPSAPMAWRTRSRTRWCLRRPGSRSAPGRAAKHWCWPVAPFPVYELLAGGFFPWLLR